MGSGRRRAAPQRRSQPHEQLAEVVQVGIHGAHGAPPASGQCGLCGAAEVALEGELYLDRLWPDHVPVCGPCLTAVAGLARLVDGDSPAPRRLARLDILR